MENSSLSLDHEDPATDTLQWSSEQLLDRFVKHRDQRAFGELVHRYSAMVFGVCRRVLRNHHDAEDAFQATFVLLARKAASIQNPSLLTAWLYQVASNASLRTKSSLDARKQKETSMKDVPEPTVVDQERWRDLEPLLDRELNNLPSIYRLPLLLCDLAGTTHKEAARQLGCPEGTLSSRLSRAREMLAQRLTRSGVVITSTALAVLIAQGSASAAAPTALVASTINAVAAASAAESSIIGSIFSKIASTLQSIWAPTIGGKVAAVTVAGTMLAVGAIALQPAAQPKVAVAVAPPPAGPIGEAVSAYRTNYEAIKSIRVEATAGFRALIDGEVLWNAWKQMPFSDMKGRSILVLDGEKALIKQTIESKSPRSIADQIRKTYPNRFSDGHKDPMSSVSYQEVVRLIPDAQDETIEGIWIYDGKHLRSNNGGVTLGGGNGKGQLPVFNIQNPAEIDRPFFAQTNFLDMVLYGIAGSKIPQDLKFRERFRVPELLTNGKWSVTAQHESFDGADCLVIESTETDKLWLERKSGYALRRWTKTSPYRMIIETYDLRNVGEGIWLPQKIVESYFADTKLPKEYVGKPWGQMTINVKQIELNQPVEPSEFQLVPPEGAMLFDATIKPLDASGRPLKSSSANGGYATTHYYQPADPADVPKTVEEIRSRMNTTNAPAHAIQPTDGKPMNAARWFIIVNLGLLIAAGGYFCYRRWR